MRKSILIEAAAFTPKAALMAAEGGADRIELCSGFAEGGLSPSAGCVTTVRELIRIPVFVMIRPRVGDFVYDITEIKVMERDIKWYRTKGIDGVVLGVLDRNGKVNSEAVKRLVDAAGSMEVTFHRAFDLSDNPLESIDLLVNCGVKRVLSSGCRPNAMEGLATLKKMVEHAGGRIGILPGGGVSAENVKTIVDTLQVKEVHLSGKTTVHSPMEGGNYAVSLCNPSDIHDFQWYECDPDKIRAVRDQYPK